MATGSAKAQKAEMGRKKIRFMGAFPESSILVREQDSDSELIRMRIAKPGLQRGYNERAMFTGHYSVAFASKAYQPRIPLWTLFIATQFLDFVWAVLVLAGIEKARIVPGLMAASALDLYYMPFTHSLVGALALSVAGGLLLNFAVKGRDAITAFVLGCAVFSHWIADLLVHRPDLPLMTDSCPKLGFGMWNYFWPEFILEIVLLAVTLVWWLRTERSGATVRAGFILFGLLVIAQCVDKFGPVPGSSEAAAWMALTAYTVLALVAAWAGRGR